MKLPKSSQSGFTLVEIAIVLVIIGILLAGVLKGQSLINNSRIKGLVNNMNAVSSAYNGYVDRYQAVPGTESRVTTTARGWVLGVNGPAAATPLTAALLPPGTTFATAGTQTNFWDVLGAAGFFAVSPLTLVNPTSANGGAIGVSYNTYALSGLVVCLNNLPPQIAEGVDVVIDGPLPTTNVGNNAGSVQGTTTVPPVVGAPGAAPYVETAAVVWNLCKTV